MYSILIADDEALEREVLSLFIKKSNLPIGNIIIAEDGNDAFVKLVCDKPEIAILDINMPELSGLDVLEKIRKEKLDTKVLISTAFDEFDYAVKALKLGATDFLVKPVLKKNFLNAIENTISKLDLENKNKTKMEQLDNVIEYFKNNSVSNLTHSNDTIPEAVILIKNYIEDNYSNYISLDDIVRGCGYSKYHISRLFKNYMNCTIMEYLLNQRLTKAKELLVKTSSSIKEIALSVGFSDPNYFSLIFKREEGISPLQYRAAKK
jgi:YesN/AraC family two-component response regulator